MSTGPFRSCLFWPLGRSSCLTQDFIEKTREWYFDNLLRGCLFHAIITDANNLDSTTYSQVVRNISWNNPETIDKFRRKHVQNVKKTNAGRQLEQRLRCLVDQRYDQVRDCWSSPEFTGSKSFEFAHELMGINHKNKIYEEVIADAMGYIDLLISWPIFTRAIIRMPFGQNLWLFEDVE